MATAMELDPTADPIAHQLASLILPADASYIISQPVAVGDKKVLNIVVRNNKLYIVHED